MTDKYRAILLAAITAGLAACGGGESDSPARMQDATGDEPRTRQASNADAGIRDLSPPEGVTIEMIEDGKSIFAGRGICTTCHGQDGTGMPNLGSDLTDDEWLHSDGSYEGIVQTIMDGVTVNESTVGLPMPPKGGSGISDDQVKSVAAYVWTLSK